MVRSKSSNTIVAIFLAVTFLAVALFGVLIFFSADEMGHAMSDCPFAAGQTALCPMSLFNHLAAWQKLFSPVAPLFVLLLMLMLALVVFTLAPRIAPAASEPHHTRQRPLFIFSSLQRAFSNGILHPRLYA